MKIHIIAIGKCKQSEIINLCHHYIKQISPPPQIIEIPVKTGWSQKDEEKAILDKMDKIGGHFIALDEQGENITSQNFAQKLDTFSHVKDITFIIGGADGLTGTIRQRCTMILSFGKLTWPHMIVRLMLIEQIYRAIQILKGHPYHRD